MSEQGQRGEKGVKGEKSKKGNAAEAFEDLHVYQRAREMTAANYQLTRAREFATDRALVDQIRRAAVSVMSNIAEGFERGSKTEFIQFLFIAKGSCGEVRSQLQIAFDQHYLAGEEYNRLHNLARLTSGMLSNFIAHLQKSEYQGEKFARPQRQSLTAQQSRMEALKAAQAINMRSQERRKNEESPNA
jgi:four helix bundle protein